MEILAQEAEQVEFKNDSRTLSGFAKFVQVKFQSSKKQGWRILISDNRSCSLEAGLSNFIRL